MSAPSTATLAAAQVAARLAAATADAYQRALLVLHQPSYSTSTYRWTSGFGTPQAEPRTHWTCSCGIDSSKRGGGYTSPERAQAGHRTHARRSPVQP